METEESDIILNSSTTSSSNTTTPTSMLHCSTMRRLLYYCVQIPSVCDVLPRALNYLATSGKHSFLFVPLANLILLVLWLPFWLLSYVTTEWGIYALFVGTVFFVGRIIIRLLAFPGSSQRVSGEIEKEFSKYSVRMLQASVASIIELTSAISSLDSSSANNAAYYDIASSWKRVQSYRSRVLGLFYHVLIAIYGEPEVPSANPGNNNNNPQLNAFGNNRLTGDIGNMSWVTISAQADGRKLMGLLGKVLSEITSMETVGSTLLNNTGRFVPQDAVNDQVKQAAQTLFQATTELKLLLPGLANGTGGGGDDEEDGFEDEEDMTMDTVRRRLEREGGGSTWDAIKASAGSILPMLDPAPHPSVFGLDVLRGTVLSRYKGASQLWIRRPGGGRLDCFHIPALASTNGGQRSRKAVLYCNPNAGLIEVATGMSLGAGNCSSGAQGESGSGGDDNCWTDYYTQRGFDVYLFNYAGFGRSQGTASSGNRSRTAGCLGACFRIWYGAFIAFKPTPDSLRADALAVGTHIINELGVDALVIHGESIGGMAAAGAARGLANMPSTKDKVALLICDRTFANLQAIAQRLVGNWTAPAISSLAPLWNMDVAADFLAASCPKVVAQDTADSIIADAGSLKSGVALWKEIRRETNTKSIGWAMEAPVEYRAADFENVGVRESRLSPTTAALIQPLTWPADKHITQKDGFHFAACARRIGKLSTLERRANRSRSSTSDEEMGVELDYEGNSQQQPSNSSNALFAAWRVLASCDGLCGSTLGSVVKNGHDWTVTWLCCAVTYGGQVVAASAEKRLSAPPSEQIQIAARDFDSRPNGYQNDENDMMLHPKPIPEVITILKRLKENEVAALRSIEHELSYCIGMLEYVVQRLSSPQVVQASRQGLHLSDVQTGTFLDLHCGHNNQFSVEERVKLSALLDQAMSTTPRR